MSRYFLTFVAIITLAFPAYAQNGTAAQPAASASQPAASSNSSPTGSDPTKPGQVNGDQKKQFSPNDSCVTDTSDKDFGDELTNNSRPMGEAIVTSSRYLPTGQRVDVGIRRSYTNGLRYFAAYEDPPPPATTPKKADSVLSQTDENQAAEGKPAKNGSGRRIFGKGEVLTRQAISSDNLVKAKLLNPDETIVTLELDADDLGWWTNKTLYIYTCLGSPTRVSQTNITLSPHSWSLWITGLVVTAIYLLLGLFLRQHDGTFQGYFASLSLARLSAGPDGKASLSKFQVIGFSLLVFALLLLLLLQTGNLSELNATILGLLGINGLGATIAKGQDGSRNVLTPDNRAWLIQHDWLNVAPTKSADTSKASFRDFFMTDGEFDVYRFQSFIFALVIGASMIIAGVGELSSFSVPSTILGIVGLSQAVYIGGKIVTPTTMKALNESLDALRDREKKLRAAALLANNSQPIASLAALQLLGGNDYIDYKAKAAEVRAFYTSETGVGVLDSELEPIA